MQLATIEFARHVAGFGAANSTELDPSTAHPVVCIGRTGGMIVMASFRRVIVTAI